jgi:hypothetical protein
LVPKTVEREFGTCSFRMIFLGHSHFRMGASAWVHPHEVAAAARCGTARSIRRSSRHEADMASTLANSKR